MSMILVFTRKWNACYRVLRHRIWLRASWAARHFVGTPLLTGLQVERQRKSMKKNGLSRLRRDSLPLCGQRVFRLHDKRAASSIDVNNLREFSFGTRIANQDVKSKRLLLRRSGSLEGLCH